MATPYKDMETTLWAWLQADADYVALGLNEYRGYDGNVLPFDRGGPLPGSDLPAIGGLLGPLSTGRAGPQHQHSGRLTFQIVYRVDEHPEDRDELENAFDIVTARFNSGEALAASWGDADAIATGEVIIDGMRPWGPRERGSAIDFNTVLFWEGRLHFDFTLNRNVG